MLDLTQAVVVGATELSDREQQAIRMLIEAVEKRTQVCWKRAEAYPPSAAPTISRLARDGDGVPEGYRIQIEEAGVPRVSVTGNDERGVLFGIGHLHRLLRMRPGQAMLPADIDITTAVSQSGQPSFAPLAHRGTR